MCLHTVYMCVHAYRTSFTCKSYMYANNHFMSVCVYAELCAYPRSSIAAFVVLGVITFGISLLIWKIYLKCQSNEKGKHV